MIGIVISDNTIPAEFRRLLVHLFSDFLLLQLAISLCACVSMEGPSRSRRSLTLQHSVLNAVRQGPVDWN